MTRLTMSSQIPPKSPTTARCLGHIGTAFIAPDGGRANIAAKTLATLWYVLIVPDAQSRLHRHIHHKRMPWYAPSRIFGIVLAAANIVTMPLSWGLLFAGKKNASRLAALGVLLNPPSIQLTTLLVSELSAALVRKSICLVRGAGAIAAKPFKKKDAAEESAQPSQGETTATPNTETTTSQPPSTAAPPTEAPSAPISSASTTSPEVEAPANVATTTSSSPASATPTQTAASGTIPSQPE